VFASVCRRSGFGLAALTVILTSCGGATVTSLPGSSASAASVTLPKLIAPGNALSFETPALQRGARRPLTFTPFESAVLGTAAQDLTVGPDGNLWITTQGNPGTIVRMSPKGVSNAFTYPVGDNGSLSLSITPGPDGALWFVDYNANLVGRITTKGVVTTYPLPTNNQSGCELDATNPVGITAGPDGAMWFTVRNGQSGSLGCPKGQNSEIGRITTTGNMAFVSMPTIDGNINSIDPLRITAGPDGMLWFTTSVDAGSEGGLGVGSITTAGVITVGSGFPGTGETAGDYLTFSSKNLYVSDHGDGTIIHVSRYAAAATYPVPGIGGAGYGPYGITPDSQGRLWFTTHTDGDVEQLGSMTHSGQFKMYQVPPSYGYGCCGSLAFREKRQLWLPYGGTSSQYGNVNVIEATNVP
jgi:virginiamycin B lyase